MRSIKKQIKTQEAFDHFCLSVKNYTDYCEENKTDRKFIKHFSTFANCWRDWIIPPENSSVKKYEYVTVKKAEGVA
jgi:hypothetical protein